MSRLIRIVLFLALIVNPLQTQAETVAIPIFVHYPQLQFLMERGMFNGPENSAQYSLDDDGCTTVAFSSPQLSAQGELLRIDVQTSTAIGTSITGDCSNIAQWKGRTVFTGTPAMASGQPLSVQFLVQDAQLYDQQDRLLSDNLIFKAFEKQFYQVLNQFMLDLRPATHQLKTLLPSVLPHYSVERMAVMIDSLRIRRIAVRPEGLQVDLEIDVGELQQIEPEPTLSAVEIQQLEQRLQTWDVFLTFVIKQAAAVTRSAALRLALLEILLDARYQLDSTLVENTDSGTDPVKQLFIRSWERLEPVLEEISAELPEQGLLPFLSFMTAADALKALDRLGPAVGLEISTDGLRRLARLLNNNPSVDPLKYMDEIDQELQKLFDIGNPQDPSLQGEPYSFNLQLIRSATAATTTPRDRLNRWVPSNVELESYLLEIRKLLLEQADARIHSSSMAQEHAHVFRELMLATAWQESCWRQYVVEKRKIVPLVSGSGDLGLLQINARVWRGFYSPQKLRWDITYNARAGSEILFKYMVSYALKRKEHKKVGGLSNLARASYSAYNGGPSQVSRYRRDDVRQSHKKIDAAFWEKYRQVKQGKELAVAQCISGDASVSTTVARPAMGTEKKSKPRRSPASKELPYTENGRWISKRNPKHLTLQLAALSSEQAVKSLIKKQSQPGVFAYYRSRIKGKERYVAIYGSFETRDDAEKAAVHFAPRKSWIREFGAIQEIMSQ
ncbi:MAG: transglycosylase SLT domain-containing protein [Gammaproteobacteria bacterium]|nr:transglycosylase SLT domain-containing protein [Gammaproteobacteria bacterium]